MELKIIWEVFWRRKWIILQVFLLLSLTVIIGTFFLPPVYESTSRLLLKKSSTESSLLLNIGVQDNRSTTDDSSDYEMENTIEIATSKPILNTVISNLQIADASGELLDSDKILNPGLLSMKNPSPTIEVNAIDETDLFEIISTSTNPEEAAMIANTLAQECIKKNSDQKKEEFKYIKEFITDQINTVKKKYITALEKIKIFSVQNKTLDIEYEIEDTIDRISDLMKEKEATVIELANTQAKIKELQKQLGRQNEQVILGMTSSGNTYIEELRNNIIDYEMQLEEVLVEKKKDHPDAKILEQKLLKSRSELNREIFLSKQYSTDLLTLERDLAALKVHVTGLNKEIDNHLINFSSIPETVFKDSQLKIDVEINQELYKSMLEYLYQIRIAELSILSDFRIVEEATVSDIEKPVSPNKVLNGVLGIVMGIICGFGLGFLVDYLDDTIKTHADVRKTGATLLGSIPKLKQNGGKLLISEKSPKDPISEAYRSIRNSIRFSSLDKPIKSLVVTSPIANEGKSTTASNLAISMTYEGKKVLLVDGDYRIPTVHKLFDLENHIGSTNILAQQANIDDAIQDSGTENLSVLTTGPIPPDPAQLVESNKMKELIHDLSDRFDIVILDSPPILIANDAIILAGFTDAVITIMESYRETYSIFNRAKETFALANIKPMGIVLNKFHVGRSQKYDYYYEE